MNSLACNNKLRAKAGHVRVSVFSGIYDPTLSLRLDDGSIVCAYSSRYLGRYALAAYLNLMERR